jgi:hypothetical protein
VAKPFCRRIFRRFCAALFDGYLARLETFLIENSKIKTQKMTRECLTVFLICLFISACNFSTVSKQSNSTKDIESIPIESVDADTNGRRSGNTHFYLNSGELFLSYEYFDSDEIADSKYLEKKNADGQVLSTEPIFDKNEKRIGEKMLAVFVSKENDMRFCLFWIKGNKLTKVSAASLEAIKEFERTYKI